MRALWEDQQQEVDRLELRSLLDEIELPLVEVLYRLERQGVKLDTYLLGETAARVSDEIEELEHRDLGARGRGVHDRLTAAALAGSCSRSSS